MCVERVSLYVLDKALVADAHRFTLIGQAHKAQKELHASLEVVSTELSQHAQFLLLSRALVAAYLSSRATSR